MTVKFAPMEVDGYMMVVVQLYPSLIAKYQFHEDGSTLTFRDANAARRMIAEIKQYHDDEYVEADEKAQCASQIAAIEAALRDRGGGASNHGKYGA